MQSHCIPDLTQKLQGTKDGKIMEFKADPKTGAIVTEKIDD